MTQNRGYLLIIGGVVLLAALGLGGWYGYTNWWGGSQGATQQGGFTVMADKQPSLDKALLFPASFPEDAKALVQERVDAQIAALKENPADYAAWLDLAISYKTVEDYEFARDIWEYVNVAAPTQSISFQNLGDLYTNYLKDYPKAEENYLEAIKNAPNQMSAYVGLADLYHYSYKQDSSSAVDILKQGIDAIGVPQNVDLTIALAAYYKSTGDTVRAIEQYTVAQDAARKLKNTILEQQLQTEINALQ